MKKWIKRYVLVKHLSNEVPAEYYGRCTIVYGIYVGIVYLGIMAILNDSIFAGF